MTENHDLKTYGIFGSQKNEKLINRLQSERYNLILLPESKIKAIEPTEFEHRIISEIDKFDWLIFFEPDGVDFFFGALNKAGVDLFELDNLRICALGELTADRLRFEQIHTDIIFAVDQKHIGDLIGEYVGNENDLKNQKILIISEADTHLASQRQLKESQMICTTLNLFGSVIRETADFAKLKALLRGGAIDEIILTSAQDLISLRKFYRPVDYIQTSDFLITADSENLVRFFLDNGLTAKLFR